MSRSKERQDEIITTSLEQLIPQEHFLRKLKATVSFDFIYDIMAPLYSDRGRPSIDPVILIKMLLIGYLYNIDSERRLEEEARYNMAYRWFLGLSLDAPVPDHSTISQNRRRRFHGRDVFREIFEKIVEKCAAAGLVQGERVVMDSTHIKANADNRNSQWVGVIKTPQAYWDELGVAELPAEGTLKSKNPCDPEAGYMNRTGKPKGFHYLDHQCSDADTGIILDVFVTGGNVQDCECCTERFQYLKEKKGYPIREAGLDSGYDTIAIHFGLTRLGVAAYIPPFRRGARDGRLSGEKFQWEPEKDRYVCPNGCELTFRGVWMTKGVPMRNYVSCQTDCGNCPKRNKCVTDKTTVRKIRRHPCQEFMEAGRTRVGSYAYRSVLRRRQAVCEGNFGLQKRCHNLRFTRKRGIENVLEQCLLSATALNLKRLVKGLSLSRVPGGMSAISALPTRDFAVFTTLILACVSLRGGTASAGAFCQQTQIAKPDLSRINHLG